MSKTMSNATSKTVEDAGHLVPGDKPIEFTKLVIDFLS
jgi:pimeloyl-ACP methyl ester carboxylesterase